MLNDANGVGVAGSEVRSVDEDDVLVDLDVAVLLGHLESKQQASLQVLVPGRRLRL